MELKECIRIIRKKIWLIVAVIVIACAATGIYSYNFTVPVYEASTKLIVNKSTQVDQGITLLDSNSITTNLMLINSYKEIIQSTAIMDKVVQQYPNLRMTSDRIIHMIQVETSNNSQVMTVTVRDDSYAGAAELVNAITKVFKTEIPSIMNVDNVTILSEAKLDINVPPVSPNPKLLIVFSFVCSFIFSIILVFAIDYLDDTIKSESDVMKYLQLPTLSVINSMKKEEKYPRASKSTKKQVGEQKYVSANQ